METNQMFEMISTLGKEWKNVANDDKLRISKEISAYLMEADGKQLKALVSAVRSLSWLTEDCLDYILVHIYKREEIKKLFPLSRRRTGQRQKLAERYRELLEAEFQSARFKEKVEIFQDANQNRGDEEIDSVCKLFCRRHWQELTYNINNLEKGLVVYDALVGNHLNCPEIWPTVAAIKIIKVWTKQSNVEEIAKNQDGIIQKLKLSLQPGKILVAQEIIRKMG